MFFGLGVTILMLLRCIVITTWSMTSATSIPCCGDICLEDSAMIQKPHFEVGALMDVWLAWTCDDIVLGLTARVVQSVITMVAALMWCRGISYTGSLCHDDVEFNQGEPRRSCRDPLTGYYRATISNDSCVVQAHLSNV
jgi:hypothetical protein